MRRLSCLVFSLALFGLLQAPVFGQAKKEKPKDPPKKVEIPRPSFKHLDGQNLVFVVDGVGGSMMTSEHLREVNDERQLGLRIQNVPWCRQNAIFQDLVDHEAQINAAAKLACSVEAIHKDAPKARIFLLGHSAGTRVVLVAAEMAPAKSIERIFVLHAAVSSTYDLTGALKSTRLGIDNFWSSEDGILDAMVQHKGTADGQKGPAAGRAGFQLVSTDKKDVEAYRNVRQIRWTEEFCGNGGHYAWALRHNMKKALVPMFFTAPCNPPILIDKKMPKAK